MTVNSACAICGVDGIFAMFLWSGLRPEDITLRFDDDGRLVCRDAGACAKRQAENE